MYTFARIKALTLQAIQASAGVSCQSSASCQVAFSGILIPPKCTTDLNIGHVVPDNTVTWKHPVFTPAFVTVNNQPVET